MAKQRKLPRIISNDPTRVHTVNNQGQTPLHVAAAKGHQNVVEVILKGQNEAAPNLDVVDMLGNTPLHLAVVAGSAPIVTLLAQKGADINILNNAHMMPIHVAAELPNKDVVEALLQNGANPNSPGEGKWTALHYAAAQDNGEIMRLMMEWGGKPCVKCDYGYYPIHIAAKCAAASAMEALIEIAIKNGYTRESILSFKDRENNLPLHAAVNGGDIKAVAVCLKAGASVKAQQDDGSTPLHFACAQGNMEMITMMNEKQPDNFLAALLTQDVMKMTPLHRAALFNHVTVMNYLLDHGADIDSRDLNERTPLLLAASKGCWGAVHSLITKGADVKIRDNNNRNFLHLAIKFGGKLEQISGDFSKDLKNLLNEKDDFGCTPLHYASKEGHLLALDDLIRMGATLNLKNNDKQSPFHFAARYGRYNTCQRLLSSVHGPNMINETDGSGLTPLHIAAQNGHTKVIQLLLERGAVVSKDNEDFTPLHHAAAHGWTHSMRVLLSVHCNLIDVGNVEGDTALHVAAKNGQTRATTLLLTLGAKLVRNNEGSPFFDYVIHNKHQDVACAVVSHDRWEEVMQLPSPTYGCYMLGLIQHLPDVCIIDYNFKLLDAACAPVKEAEEKKDNVEAPMKALNAMVQNNRVGCLSHKVCVTLLNVKWNRYGMWVYTLYLFVYILFLASLTCFVVDHNSLMHHDKDWPSNHSTDYLYGNNKKIKLTFFYRACIWFVVIYGVANVIKEIAQIFTQRRRYFADISNLLEWSLYISSILFAAPVLFEMSFHWQWEAGAIAVFLAWFDCLVFLQRFDFFGIYVVMFLEILRTLVQVLCVFSILIIAFGLAFYMLLHQEDSKAFSTPGLAFLRTFMMMWELDYMESFNAAYVDDNPETLHFGRLTLVFIIGFVLLMPILLMNLLIGLAVGDIESVQRNARLKRLAMQVELHINMERKMPQFIYDKAQVMEYKEYPNRCGRKLANVVSVFTGSNANGNGSAEGDKGMMGDWALKTGCHMYDELHKQKVRMREMQSTLESNNQLLRKIMQKMEIHTEEDAWDEGAGRTNRDNDEDGRGRHGRNVFKSPMKKLQLKTAVLGAWRQSAGQLTGLGSISQSQDKSSSSNLTSLDH